MSVKDVEREAFYTALSQVVSKAIADGAANAAEATHALSREMVFWSNVAMHDVDDAHLQTLADQQQSGQ